MKRNALIAIVLIVLLLLTGCRNNPSVPDQTGASEQPAVSEQAAPENTQTEAEATPDTPQEDPIPEFELGVPADVQVYEDDELRMAAMDEGKLIQAVTKYAFGQGDEILGVYTYDDFLSITGEEPDEPMYYNGCALAMDLNTDSEFPVPEFRCVVHPEVYGAFKTLIEGRDYSAAEPEGLDCMTSMSLRLTDADGNETIYTLYHDGSVTDGRAFAAEPLTDRETAYFFAVRLAYAAYKLTDVQYAFLGNFSEEDAVRIEKDGTEIYLTKDQAVGFLKLVCDNEEVLSFDSVPRYNCGTGDHGEEVLRFTIGYYDGQSIQGSGLPDYALYSDGHVVYFRPGYGNYRPFFGESLTYSFVTVGPSIVSKTAFDMQAVLGYLSGLEG